MLFSQRKGFTPIRETIQNNGMDDALRHGLWNAMHLSIWDRIEYHHYTRSFRSSNVYYLFDSYWRELFKLPIDNLPPDVNLAYERIRKYFFNCQWYEVYDFIEFTVQNCSDELRNLIILLFNDILKRELSAYRFIDTKLTDITDEEEMETIESAINSTTKHSGARNHLKTAVGLLCDRKNPDYRNSIKESISAVEALCVSVSDDPKATLGAALNKIEKTHNLHPAFKKALSSLYGYTSDADGIRHAMLEESTIGYSDAKFMLASCSAFINYVLGKISEEG